MAHAIAFRHAFECDDVIRKSHVSSRKQVAAGYRIERSMLASFTPPSLLFTERRCNSSVSSSRFVAGRQSVSDRVVGHTDHS